VTDPPLGLEDLLRLNRRASVAELLDATENFGLIGYE